MDLDCLNILENKILKLMKNSQTFKLFHMKFNYSETKRSFSNLKTWGDTHRKYILDGKTQYWKIL